MNEKQRAIVGTLAIALIVASMFYIPWRIESTGNLKWAPFYRNPVVGTATRITGGVDSRFAKLKGRPVWAIYALQLVAIGAIGGGYYWVSRDKEEEEVEGRKEL